MDRPSNFSASNSLVSARALSHLRSSGPCLPFSRRRFSSSRMDLGSWAILLIRVIIEFGSLRVVSLGVVVLDGTEGFCGGGRLTGRIWRQARCLSYGVGFARMGAHNF